MRQPDDRYRDKLVRRSTRASLKSLIRRRKSLPASKIANGHLSPISFTQNSSQISLEKEPSIFEHSINMTESSPSPTIQPQSRPLSVAIPQSLTARGPYCIRRPKLEEILSNKAAPPWTLSAFMAYLSQAHCLEILEFTMDAKRYRKHYNKACHHSPTGSIVSGSEEEDFIKTLWIRLIDAYIAPNGPREVNLPSDVRDGILRYNNDSAPPSPSTLNHAVAKVMELMEDSVLQPFLNSLSPNISMEPEADSIMMDVDDSAPVPTSHTYSSSHEDRHLRRSPHISRKSSPVLSTSPAAASNRASVQSHSFSQFARGLGHSSRHTFSPPASTSTPFDTQLQPPSAVSNPASARNSTAAITPFADCFNPPVNEDPTSNTPFGSNTSSPSMPSAPLCPTSYRASSYSTHTTPDSMPEPLRHLSSGSQKSELMTPPTTPPMCEISSIAFGGSPTLTNSTSHPSRASLTSSPRSAQAMGGIAQMFHSIRDQEQGMPVQAPHPYTAYHQPSISFQPQQIAHTGSLPTSSSSMSTTARHDHARRHGSQGSLEANMQEESSKSVMLGSMNGAGVSSISISSSVGSSNTMSTWKKMRSSFFGRKKSEHEL